MFNKIIDSESEYTINLHFNKGNTNKGKTFLAGAIAGLALSGTNAAINFVESTQHEVTNPLFPLALLIATPILGLTSMGCYIYTNSQNYSELINELKENCNNKNTEETFNYLKAQFPDIEDEILNKLVQQIKS